MKFLLLGHLALKEDRKIPRTEVHQTAIAVVFVRFDSTDVEFAVGFVITVLKKNRIS